VDNRTVMISLGDLKKKDGRAYSALVQKGEREGNVSKNDQVRKLKGLQLHRTHPSLDRPGWDGSEGSSL